MDSGGVRWSSDAGQADWIAGRLSPWGDGVLTVTGVVPGGFERYARVLHPAVAHDQAGERPVRWAEIAAWSGLPLYRTAQFHSVALPPAPRPDPVPFSAGPSVGTLDLGEAAALTGVLRQWTSSPEDCWFCVWDGFGWDSASSMTSFLATAGAAGEAREAGEAGAGPGNVLTRDPVPGAVRDGPRVRLPHRDYLLYRGPAEAVTALADTAQTANLWWPADRAWCVATEIDLRCTYIGGPAGLIDALCSGPRIEALPALPADPVSLVLEDWVAAWVDDLTTALLAEGEAVLTTGRGTVRAWLRLPSGTVTGLLRTEVTTDDGDGRSGSSTPLRRDDPGDLRDRIVLGLTMAVVGLAPE